MSLESEYYRLQREILRHKMSKSNQSIIQKLQQELDKISKQLKKK